MEALMTARTTLLRTFRTRCVMVTGVAVIVSAGTAVFAGSTPGLRTTPLGDLRIISQARASVASTTLGSAVNAASAALNQVEGQTLQWSVSQAQFVPSLTQVLNPSGLDIYDTSKAINAWVVRMSAPPQCGYSLLEGVVVFDDDWGNVVLASALETNSAGPSAGGCPSTPVTSTDPTSSTPQTSTPTVQVTQPPVPLVGACIRFSIVVPRLPTLCA
jgi:hypothetical protein